MAVGRWRRLVVVAAASALAACVAPQADRAADGAAGSPPELKPLTQHLAVPVGVTPRSAVAAVSYDIFSAPEPTDLPWDDERMAGSPTDGSRPAGSFGSGFGTGGTGGFGDAAAALRELERGGASWYGIQFHQKKTANGERFDMGALTAAHKTLPFGTQVCVRSLVNNREVMVRINDRGPFAIGRVIDLSRSAAEAIGMLGLGIKQVALSVVGRNQRCGSTVNPVDAVEPLDTVLQPPPARRTRPLVVRAQREVPSQARR